MTASTRLGGRAKFRDAANRAFGMPPCGQPPLECDDVEWPVEPNPPRELDVLGDVLRELDELLQLRVPLDEPGRNAVEGAIAELRRERSYECEPEPQRQLPHERRRRHGSSCAAGLAPGAGAAAGAACAGGRHSAERAGIM